MSEANVEITFAVAAREMGKSLAALAPLMRRFAELVREAGEMMEAAMWEAYEEAGFPYGPNYAGRDRWLREKGEAMRLREKADEIELEHQMLAELRRVLGRE